MTLFTKEHLATLLVQRPGWHVSLYIPTYRAGVETLQNPVRCKNLLRQAEKRLCAGGMRPLQVHALLEPAHKLLADYEFWQHQSDGLALFVAPDMCEAYRLPLAFAELVVVNQRFHLTPLFPLLSEDGQFYVLALSQNQVRMLQCTRYSVTDITPPDLPTSLAEALRYNDPERQRQFHTETAPCGPPSSGERGALRDCLKSHP